MDYLYRLTVEVDEDMVFRLRQHDLNAVYETIRTVFTKYNFTENSNKGDKSLVFTIAEGKDVFSDVGIVTNALYDSWLGKYLKRMDWYDASDDSTEDVLKEIRDFDAQYGKPKG